MNKVLGSSVSVPLEPLLWFTKFSKTLGSTIAFANNKRFNQQLPAKETPSVADCEIIRDLTKLVSSFSGATTNEGNVMYARWESELMNFFNMYKDENLNDKYKVELASLTLRESALGYFREIESSVSSVEQLVGLMGKRLDTRLNKLQVYLKLQALYSISDFKELAKAITEVENKAPPGFPHCFYIATFLVASPPEIRSFMSADNIDLTSSWRTCLNRARCYASNLGISNSMVSNTGRTYHNFLAKLVRNSHNNKDDS
ncbi:uncharacterized protein PWA37_003749 [Arxiozyma heterogenica]|uniref:uncharacterized protein n=1 Tax=Arxiozyma heterogenica TaxID=278026 RepID=UPI002F1D6CAB